MKKNDIKFRKLTVKDAAVVIYRTRDVEKQDMMPLYDFSDPFALAVWLCQLDGTAFVGLDDENLRIGMGGLKIESRFTATFWVQTTDRARPRHWAAIRRKARDMIDRVFQVAGGLTRIQAIVADRLEAKKLAYGVGLACEGPIPGFGGENKTYWRFGLSRRAWLRAKELETMRRVLQWNPGVSLPSRAQSFAGGLGVGGGNPADEAQRREDERRKKINDTISAIEAIFDKPDPNRLENIKNTTTAYYTPKLAEQREQGSRDLKFELARRGLIGGSAEVDALEQLQKREDEAREQIGSFATQAVDRAKALDNALKNNLIAQANAGGNQETLTSNALSGQLTNATQAQNEIKLQNLGNLFSDAGLLFRNIEVGRGNAAGRSAIQNLLAKRNPFSRSSTSSYYGSIS